MSLKIMLRGLWSLLLLTACAPSATPVAISSSAVGTRVSVEGGAYTNVNPAELKAMLQSKDFILINTHLPYEGEIAPTDQFIAFVEAGPQRISEYPTDKSAQIVLYCRSGRMSAIVAQGLVEVGYTNVWNLNGGMIAWEEAGYELLTIQ